jgi:PAS domain S-box-containing protein
MSVTLKPKNTSQAHRSTQPTPQGTGRLSAIKAEVSDILGHIKDVVFQTDARFYFTYLNESWQILTGFAYEESIEQLSYFIHHEYITNFQESLEIKIAQRKALETEVRLLHKSGEAIFVELFVKPLFDQYSNLTGTVGTMRDITLRKKEEEELKTAHEALQKSDKEAQRLNLELETFMYKSSHDLLGPLASIHGLLVLAKEQENHPETVDYLKMITKSANQLMITLENLLEVSKIKQGKPQISNIDFEAIMQEVLTLLGQNQDFAQIEFSAQINVKSSFYSDKNLIFNILYRLIENAFAYRRTNITPYIRVHIVGDAHEVKLKVIDNGQGMIDEVQEKIFDMFFKGSELNRGSGLGLYIVKNALEKLNGTIQVDSRERRGSEFTAIIPSIS